MIYICEVQRIIFDTVEFFPYSLKNCVIFDSLSNDKKNARDWVTTRAF